MLYHIRIRVYGYHYEYVYEYLAMRAYVHVSTSVAATPPPPHLANRANNTNRNIASHVIFSTGHVVLGNALSNKR